MKSHLPVALTFTLLLSQCVDPYFYGQNDRYDPSANPYRQGMRDEGGQLNQAAYERGWQDGQVDAGNRQSQNYQRYRSRFGPNTEMAYRDGYNQGYSRAHGSLGGDYLPPGGGYGNPAPPQPANNPIYNQGYDYGLRDLTNGQPPDPAAHVGRYDPRHRTSFERGYYDGYNSRSNQGAPSSGGLWFR